MDGDSNRDNFGEIHKLIPLCDEIIKLKAYCSMCKDGTPGIFSKRISEKKDKILVGSDEDYIAVCRKCYLQKSCKVAKSNKDIHYKPYPY